jgi:hypothetical protein
MAEAPKVGQLLAQRFRRGLQRSTRTTPSTTSRFAVLGRCIRSRCIRTHSVTDDSSILSILITIMIFIRDRRGYSAARHSIQLAGRVSQNIRKVGKDHLFPCRRVQHHVASLVGSGPPRSTKRGSRYPGAVPSFAVLQLPLTFWVGILMT